ncbi:hypothetical protein L7F22_049326 [Adiantum nelumboides]|nr:hypothetical protein [Adiantum nelumboides]
MEGRDSMSLSQGGMVPGLSSFGAILQRGIVVPPGGSSPAMPASPMPPPGLHAPSPMRPTSGLPTGAVNNSSTNQLTYAPDIASGGMGSHPVPLSMHMSAAPGRSEPIFKRKRGRPRKYGPDGSMALALVSHSAITSSTSPVPKRGRGRPPGSGRKQQLEALGTAGVGFTPHIITIAAGEDVAMKIMSFSQQGPRAICILSANGAVSNATLRQPATSGGTVTYEGRFEILSLSGSFLPQEDNGICSRTGGLSVSLAGSDGRVVGGGVAGLLMAAGPVQVVVGSFIPNSKKSKQAVSDASVPTTSHDANTAPQNITRPSANESLSKFEIPSSTGIAVYPSQSHNMMTAFHSIGWSGSHQPMSVDVRRNTDINISLPGS